MPDTKFESISIIGDGAMGTVIALLLCDKGVRTRMWGYDRSQLSEIQSARENIKFLPSPFEIPTVGVRFVLPPP